MTIQVELTTQEEADLRERAAEEGREPGELLSRLVRELLASSSNGGEVRHLPVIDETGMFREERWQAVLASIREGSSKAPVLPAEALRREALYQDHN
jgi:hypothetical protein